MTKILPSPIDNEHFKLLRDNITSFLACCAERYDAEGILVLDVAPQVHAGAKSVFVLATIETLDIDPESGATYILDLCNNNENKLPSDYFDIVNCNEVLEHTLQPFRAVAEMFRILKPGGLLLLTVPFNFRMHGPLPDCWRFTEHGLKAILSDFEIIELNPLETPNRTLMPIHYTVIAQKTTS
jgi:SAM-dependent methyltransferase